MHEADIARLRLVHDSDRLERRFESRHRNIGAVLFGLGLLAAAVLGPWVFAMLMFALAVVIP